MSVLQEIEAATRSVVEEAGDSVVGIGRAGPRGTGVVIGEGRVLTNAHNVRGGAPTVTFADGRKEEARLQAADTDADLAVLEVETGSAPPIEWGDGAATVGTPVFALANPGGRGLRVTFGAVSSTGRAFRGPRGRRIPGGIEHTAPLPRGSSGGPIVDDRGRLVGVNTSRVGEGFYLAIPADEELRRRVDALGRGEVHERPRLGVGVAPPFVARRLRRAVGLPQHDGVLVRVVEEGSAAAAAGLEPGDLLTGVDGRDIRSIDDLYAAVDEGGERLDLRVIRGVEERTVAVSPTATSPPPERA